MDFLASVLDSASQFLASDPSVLAVQFSISAVAFLIVFLVLFTARDVLLRSESFLFQIFCILLSTLLPIVGFFLYLLIRPPRTIAERKLATQVTVLLSRLHMQKSKKHPHHHSAS